MPFETAAVLFAIVAAFALFAVAVAGVDLYSRDVRRHNHPLPGE